MGTFKRENYHPETPIAVLDIIQAAFENDELDEMDWGDDLANAVSAAQTYAANTERRDGRLQDLIERAVYAWNEEGDVDTVIASLEEAFGKE